MSVPASPPGGVRRAEPGPLGPLLLEAATSRQGVVLTVLGPPVTPPEAVERALASAAAWAGLDDSLDGFAGLVGADGRLRRLARAVGEVRLSRLPRVGEAAGRAVLSQLVQSLEARRSIAQVAVLAREPAPLGLHCWPTADAVSVGDYNLPALIGTVLGDGLTDDAGMLELLAPYAGHRGRVLRLVESAVRRGLAPGPVRRRPRAARSAHRYY